MANHLALPQLRHWFPFSIHLGRLDVEKGVEVGEIRLRRWCPWLQTLGTCANDTGNGEKELDNKCWTHTHVIWPTSSSRDKLSSVKAVIFALTGTYTCQRLWLRQHKTVGNTHWVYSWYLSLGQRDWYVLCHHLLLLPSSIQKCWLRCYTGYRQYRGHRGDFSKERCWRPNAWKMQIQYPTPVATGFQ